MHLAWVYYGLLYSWTIFQKLFQDRLWWLGLVNSLSLYWFLPTIIFLPYALFTRQLYLISLSIISFALFFFRHGKYFLPCPVYLIHEKDQPENSITFMTYNLLQSNQNIQDVIQVIRNSNAEIVFLQELNPLLEDGIRNKLSEVYPHQIYGMRSQTSKIARNGILSKYPLEQINDSIGGTWSSDPLICKATHQKWAFFLINIHAFPHRFGTANLREIALSHQIREHSNKLLLSYIEKIAEPIVVSGDFNTTDQNSAYQIIQKRLMDSWLEAGCGLGHTFGIREDTLTNRKLPKSITQLLPKWIVRIDYIFHSKHWVPVEVKMGQWDGYSDHRPIIAKLVLTNEKA